ncbi:MAG: L-histidine N(alpha)-methyltransferase [Pseudomonadota bacterium]
MTAINDFGQSLLQGLLASPKHTEAKWFYDERGSALFDQICRTKDYYPTRTEIMILEAKARAMVDALGGEAVVLEPGAGSVVKIRYLLDVDHAIKAYVPFDISGEHLDANAEILRADYPELAVIPATGDFTQTITLPRDTPENLPITIFFPGSTIGNFEPERAEALLRRFADVPNALNLILGADLRKDEAVLLRAYDDSEGVTAAFNRNILVRANRELGADFDPNAFAHHVRYDHDEHRIEMHLESLQEQSIQLLGQTIPFAKGETIHTENSYKYDEESLIAMARPAGWSLEERWYDEQQLFGVFLFTRS